MYQPSLVNRPNLQFRKPEISLERASGLYSTNRTPSFSIPNRKLAVSIVAYNEREPLLNLVRKVLSQQGDVAYIQVVDNGLDEDIKSELLALDIHYILASENLGCSGGRNLSAAFIETEFVAFLDADGDIDSDYIATIIRIIDGTDFVTVRGRVKPFDKASRVPPTYDLGSVAHAAYPAAEGISVWRTDAFKKAGGFEVDLYGGEGVVLCYRMVNLFGYALEQFQYDPALILHHDYNNDLTHLESKEIRNSTNRWNIDRRYPLLEDLLTEFKNIRKLNKIVRPPVRNNKKVQELVAQAREKFHTQQKELFEQNLQRRLKEADKLGGSSEFKFGVVITCFNLGKFLPEAIDSVLRQTIDSLQVIVVDDASTDEHTIAFLDSLPKSVEVLRLSKNGGVANARNAGIAKINAKYILCLDGDDYLGECTLEEAFNIFNIDQAIDVVASNVNRFGEHPGKWTVGPKVTLVDALVQNSLPIASAFKKESWAKTGGYDSNLRGYEDWEFWISILSLGGKVSVNPRRNFNYRTSASSKVHTSNQNADQLIAFIAQKHSQTYAANIGEVMAKVVRDRVAAKDRLAKALHAPNAAAYKFAKPVVRFFTLAIRASRMLFIERDIVRFKSRIRKLIK